MQCCCENIYHLGCIIHCDVLCLPFLIPEEDLKPDYYVLLQFAGSFIKKQLTLEQKNVTNEEGEDVVFYQLCLHTFNLNENYCYTFQVFDGENNLLNYVNEKDENFDCLQFTMKSRIMELAAEPPPIEVEPCDPYAVSEPDPCTPCNQNEIENDTNC